MIKKHTAIYSALAILLNINTVNAGTYTNATFIMLDGSGGNVGGATDVTGEIGNGTFSVSSVTPFFGIPWTAHDGVTLGSGTYNIDTIEDGTYQGITVGPDQLGGHILFDWGANTNIDVVIVWDVLYTRNGFTTYTSTDSASTVPANPDGIRGYGMLDGAFVGFNANFDLNPAPDYDVNIQISQGGSTGNVVATTEGLVSISSNITEASATFNWDNGATDSEVIAVDTATTFDEDTLVIDPSSLATGEYSISITSTSPNGQVRADHKFTVTPISLSNLNDTDGDTADDVTEGFSDIDSDGIPNYLDHSSYTATPNVLQLLITGDDTSSPVMKTTNGTGTGAILGVGNIAQQKYNDAVTSLAFYNDGTGNGHGPLLDSTDLISDDKVNNNCIGQCFDFTIDGLNTTTADTIDMVIPLNQGIPTNAVYRRYDGTNWKGFITDVASSIDRIASAPASSTGPIVCPAADSTAYTTGLTQGNYCIRLTIEDNGTNDQNGSLGSISHLGGVASTDQSNLENTSSAIDGVGGGWWFLMGIPALIGLRRYANSK